jgi:hypothetical protein
MFKRCLTPSLLVLPLFLTACGEPEDLRVFNEVGTWSMQRFALDGTNWENVDQDVRKNAFLIRFDTTEGSGVVGAATCGGSDPNQFGVKSSLCNTYDREYWRCRCFSYLHEEKNLMEWQEFAPGEAVPPVVSETGEDAGEGADTEGDPSDSIAVQKDPEINGAVLLQPLPYTTNVCNMPAECGLFDSDGMNSKYQFLKKADNLFDQSGCAEACGI